jgi:hypothetical protein
MNKIKELSPLFKMVVAARQAGYDEFEDEKKKRFTLKVCDKCFRKRMVRFYKKKGSKKSGAAVIDKCWGCGNYVVITKKAEKAPKAKKAKGA